MHINQHIGESDIGGIDDFYVESHSAAHLVADIDLEQISYSCYQSWLW